MSTTTLLLIGGAALAVLLLVVVLAVTIRHGVGARRELSLQLAATRDDVERLERQVEELERALRRFRAEARETGDDSAFVVTEAGVVRLTDPSAEAEPVAARPVPDQVVLSATLGEPLVKAAAFSHGVRRALSAESRNRIRFAMRQEVRRSRRQRRRDMKAAYRAMQMEGNT